MGVLLLCQARSKSGRWSCVLKMELCSGRREESSLVGGKKKRRLNIGSWLRSEKRRALIGRKIERYFEDVPV